MKNKLTNMINRIERLPIPFKVWFKSLILGNYLPFVGTVGLRFVKTTNREWTVDLKNRRKVRNHLRQVHAGAMVLLAETTAVFLTASNLSDDKIPLVKRIEADFVKRSKGSLTANAVLTNEQIHAIQSSEKGDIKIDVKIVDEAHNLPIIVTITAAWISKTKKGNHEK